MSTNFDCWPSLKLRRLKHSPVGHMQEGILCQLFGWSGGSLRSWPPTSSAYSRLIETDEARTLAAIRALRSEVIDPLIADHRGRIVKLMGDGAIVEFGSVVDAVACAVAVQEGTTVHQREVPPESRIVFRIGINVGDVVVEDGDLLGDGVNIAARLEALAEPGRHLHCRCGAEAAGRQD